MKKFYVIFPALGVLIFGAFYWHFSAGIEEAEKQKTEARLMEAEARKKADFEAKRKAVEVAIANQEKRKQEKADREKREAEERQVQLDLNDASDKARNERDRVLRLVDKVKAEINVEDAGLKRIAEDKKNLVSEDEFLQQYVKEAEANQKKVEQILTKIEAADKALMAQATKKKS